jgi:hypothetical protein
VAQVVVGSTAALTAGDWDVGGYAVMQPSVGAASYNVSINTTQNALGSGPLLAQLALAGGTTLLGNCYVHIPPYRVSLTATTNYFVNVVANFSTGTCSCAGSFISARRAR